MPKKKLPDPTIDADFIAERIISEIWYVADMGKLTNGYSYDQKRKFYRFVLELALTKVDQWQEPAEIIQKEAEAFRRQREQELDNLRTWATQEGLLEREAVLEKLGLTQQEFKVAEKLGIVQPVYANAEAQPNTATNVPVYRVPPQLDDEDWQKIREQTRLSRLEAARWLGISENQFDTLRKKHGLVPVAQIQTSKGYLLNLYSLDDIARLGQAAADLKLKTQKPKRTRLDLKKNI